MKYFWISALGAVLLCGCDNNADSSFNVRIEPGKFVTTEPGALHGSLGKSDKCSLDTINGKTREPKVGWQIKRGVPIDIQGWAFSSDGKHAAPEIYVQLSGPVDTYYAVSSQRTLRNDANQHLATDPALQGGFVLHAATDAIEPGNYEINVMQVFSDRRETCEDGVSLTVE